MLSLRRHKDKSNIHKKIKKTDSPLNGILNLDNAKFSKQETDVQINGEGMNNIITIRNASHIIPNGEYKKIHHFNNQ